MIDRKDFEKIDVIFSKPMQSSIIPIGSHQQALKSEQLNAKEQLRYRQGVGRQM